jgi:LytS/YehU family sensor histidine kinase
MSYRTYAIDLFYSRFHVELITYAAILALGYTIDSLKRLALREADVARLSAELSKAQLDALRRQLEPHFLFNSLNGISGLVRSGKNDAAVDMSSGLGDLLRRVLEDSGSQLVPLAEELSFLERYVELQSVRFGDRLIVPVDVPVALYSALVPGLILQLLVENAILHRIETRVEGGSIGIGAHLEDSVLTLCVHNDGPAVAAEARDSRPGVGLSNTRSRLARLYGNTGTVELRNRSRSQGVRVGHRSH